jgi:hypothetical protein
MRPRHFVTQGPAFLTGRQHAVLKAAARSGGIRRACITDLDRAEPVANHATIAALVRRGLLRRVAGSAVFVPVRAVPETTPTEAAE